MNASKEMIGQFTASYDTKQWALAGKVVLLISPQSWTGLTLSKHHYASTLAQIGARVFFLNPPSDRSLRLSTTDLPAGITLVDCGQFARGRRFLSRSVYESLEWVQAKTIEWKIHQPIDVLWSFDPTRFNNLRQFRARMYLFHAADMPERDAARRIGSTADAVVAVSETILAEFPPGPQKRFLNHGLSEDYEKVARRRLSELRCDDHSKTNGALRAGYVGNLLHPAIDHAALSALMDVSPDVQFHFWGPTAYSDLDWDHPGEAEVLGFIAGLQRRENVTLHGLQVPSVVAEALSSMDLLLACYDPRKDRNLGSNSHKILEYLSTGKPVVSNRVSTYASVSIDKGLVVMPDTMENDGLSDLFRSVVSHIDQYSSAEMQIRRIEFALQHTYRNQLRVIDEIAQSWLL